MSKYNGLDKISVIGLDVIESYRRIKIYKSHDNNHKDVGQGFAVVSRGYCVDSDITTVENCRAVIDHFLED